MALNQLGIDRIAEQEVVEILCGRRFKDSRGICFGINPVPDAPYWQDKRADPLYPLVYEDTFCVIVSDRCVYNVKSFGGNRFSRYGYMAREIAKVMRESGIRRYRMRQGLRIRHTTPYDISKCEKLPFSDMVIFQTLLNWKLHDPSKRDQYGFPFWGD